MPKSIDRIAFGVLPAELQDIELARISQEVTERFYNLLAAGEGGRCPKWGHSQDADATRGAARGFTEQQGVCRDFAHLAVMFAGA
jgi:hypothetical protein